MSKKFFIFLVAVCMTLIFCHRNPTDFYGSGSMEIDIPLNKTCIYAQTMTIEMGDSSELVSLLLFSIRFYEKWDSGDTLFYNGEIIRYVVEGLPPVCPQIPSFIWPFAANPDTGMLLLSIGKKWVLFQNSDLSEAGTVFMKRDAVPDTTSEPVLLFNQFPIYPRKMQSNTDYSIYRPGENADDHFIPVERIFHIGKLVRWDDPYGNGEGFSFSVDHHISDFDTLRYEGIIDEHGIVVSCFTDQMLVTTTEYPEGHSFYRITRTNRRIADYSDPETLHELPWYAELIIDQGLSFLAE
jgi:hypothetical protein